MYLQLKTLLKIFMQKRISEKYPRKMGQNVSTENSVKQTQF